MTTPFISLADLSDYLKLTVTDDLATMAIDAACESVRDYIEYDPYAGTSTDEAFDGSGTNYLALSKLPVTAVTELSAYTADFATYEALVEDTDFVTDGKRGIVWRFDGGVFPAGRQNIVATYTYGRATVPSSVRLIALQVAARIYDAGMAQQETLGGYSVTYVAGAGTLNEDERRALYPYKLGVR